MDQRREPVQHERKCWPEFFEDVRTDRKPFEIRQNDRDFHVGDKLRLREWNATTESYTGRECLRTVSYLTNFAQHGGYVVLGLARNVDEMIAQVESMLDRLEAMARAERDCKGLAQMLGVVMAQAPNAVAHSDTIISEDTLSLVQKHRDEYASHRSKAAA